MVPAFPALPAIRDAVLDALALFLPVECVGCGAPDRAVCAGCRPALAPDPSSRRLADGTPVFSALDYDGVARLAILALKEQGRTELTRALAPALAAAVREAVRVLQATGVAGEGSGGAIELAAVPGSRRARARRGFDPVAALIARAGLDRAMVFAPARPHPAQKSLTLEQRGVNLAGVFTLRAAVAGRRFMLVDDVVTTGATLQSAAETLRSAGAEVVAAAVIASTPKLYGSSFGLQCERAVTFS